MTSDPTSRPAVILLVEDDRSDQELTRRSLERARIRNDLRIVNDGQEAVEYLTRQGRFTDSDSSPRPDLVLLDLNMPRLGGSGVLEFIRSNESLQTIPVVVLSTSESESDVVEAYELGANSFMSKPVDLGSFVKTVQGLGDYWLELVVLPPKPDTED